MVVDTELLKKAPAQAAHSEEKTVKKYAYKASRIHGLLALIVFSCLTVFSLYFAKSDPNGFTVYFIGLSAKMADYLFWAMAALFVLVALLGLTMFIRSFQAPRYVTLGETDMSVPKKPLSTTILTFKYSDITHINIVNFSKARHLVIKTRQGKVVVPDVNFEQRAYFDELVKTIEQRIKHSKQTQI